MEEAVGLGDDQLRPREIGVVIQRAPVDLVAPALKTLAHDERDARQWAGEV